MKKQLKAGCRHKWVQLHNRLRMIGAELLVIEDSLLSQASQKALEDAFKLIESARSEVAAGMLELHPDLAITRRLIAGEKAHVPSGPG